MTVNFPTPAFAGERMLMVVSGAVAAVHVPFWLNWLTNGYPGTRVQVILTSSATRFVTPQAVSALTRSEPLIDRWPDEPQPVGMHVRLIEEHDSVVVYPACFNFISRLATGMADTPVLLALQCTAAPIGIAPSLPPGATRNPTLAAHLKSLSERRNVLVAPTKPATSLATGRTDTAGAVPLWSVLEPLEELRRALAEDG